MPYILRNANGDVVAVSHTEMRGAGWECCDASSTEYRAYLEAATTKADKFRESDLGLARVLEDLIDLLIQRDYIRFTDLPEAAQKRLVDRQSLRKGAQELDLIDPDENVV